MKFIYTTGKRIDSRLIYTEDRQLYNKKSLEITGARYVCHRKNCRARVIVQGDECFSIKNVDVHSHADDQEIEYKSYA